MSPKLKLETVIETLHEEFLAGRTHLWVYRGLYDELVAGNIELFDAAPAFFQLTIKGNILEAYRHLWRLLDRDSRSVSVWHLLSVVKKASPKKFRYASGRRPSDLARKGRKQLVAHKKSIRKLWTRRNKILAHLDRQTVLNPQAVERLASVTLGEMEQLYKVIGDILVEIGVAYDGIIRSKEIVNRDDFRHLLKIAHIGRNAWIKGTAF